MCLQIFCEGNKEKYMELTPFACSLGAAFQKVNFLRDITSDYHQLNRSYFPNCDFSRFAMHDKLKIEADIEKDFSDAYKGVLQLPLKARFGVYVAYRYYLSLFKKIKKLQPQKILQTRVRIPDYGKMLILAEASIRNRMNIL